MRIDNHMGGLRHPGLKGKTRKKGPSKQAPPGGVVASFSGVFPEAGMHYEHNKKENPKKYVHKQADLRKAAYILATRGTAWSLFYETFKIQ